MTSDLSSCRPQFSWISSQIIFFRSNEDYRLVSLSLLFLLSFPFFLGFISSRVGPGDIPIITLGGKPFPVEIAYLDAIPQGLVPSAVLTKYLAVFKKEKPIASVDDALVDVVIACKKSTNLTDPLFQKV